MSSEIIKKKTDSPELLLSVYVSEFLYKMYIICFVLPVQETEIITKLIFFIIINTETLV
jgi:hypothetical protein